MSVATALRSSPVMLSLGEVIETLSEAMMIPVLCDLDPRRTVFVAPESDPRDPYELEVALLRSGFRIRPGRGRLLVQRRCDPVV